MKAITVWQPWASAIMLGLKKFETRGRPTKHRGLVFIHSAKRWQEDQEDFWVRSRNTLRYSHGDELTLRQFDLYCDTPALGAIVAVADLVECWRSHGDALIAERGGGTMGIDISPLERMFGDFAPGRFAWQLENVVRLSEPVPCEGRQGIWYPPAEVGDAAKDQIRTGHGEALACL